MAISTRVNGVYRDNATQLVRINGVWRDTVNWARINGVWRELSGSVIREPDIIGFRLVYKLNKNKIHPDYPNLKYNHKIPYVMDLAGENVGVMDFTHKSAIFEYNRDEYKEEGIIEYDGTLYAVLKNGSLIDVSSIILSTDIRGVHLYNRTKELEITLRGYCMYESYGYFVDGWNNFFSTDKFLLTGNNNAHPLVDKNLKRLNLYNILPVDKRDETYQILAEIGIARDMSSPENNMIGSKGTIDHTVQEIYVNDVKKPFVIEVYH